MKSNTRSSASMWDIYRTNESSRLVELPGAKGKRLQGKDSLERRHAQGRLCR